MPRKKTAAKLAEEKEEAQASVIAAILIETCRVVDAVIDDHGIALLGMFGDTMLQMERYLDGRERAGNDPEWVRRMRRTVTRFKLRLKLTRPAPSLELH